MIHLHLHLILYIWLNIISDTCNADMSDFEFTIIQGESAQHAPWQARLLTDVHDRTSGICGGTLIDNSHVLTALHCVCLDPIYSLSSHTVNCTNIREHVGVVLGDNIISLEESSEVYAMCNKIVLHPRGFDIAICELDQNVSSISAIQPIKLPLEEPPIGATVTVTGWGSTDTRITDVMANKLHEVALRLTNTCPIMTHELCTVGLNQSSIFYQGIGRGDSGGPLVLNLFDLWYLVGVASGSTQDFTTSAIKYNTFVNVYRQKEWIQSITTKNDTCPEFGILCESPEIFVNFQKTASQQRCVIQSWLCDQYPDCANGEDEENNLCNATALLQRSSMSLFEAAQKGHNEMVYSMLDAGVDVNSRDMYNYTALHYASLQKNDDLVRELLIYKADITARTLDGNTAIMLATFAESRETALILVRHGNDINAANKENTTALFWAAINGDVQLASALLGKSALPNVMDIYSNTPLLFAAFKCDYEMVRLLTLRGADVNFGSIFLPLHAVLIASCKSRQDEVLGLLLDRGANASAPGYSPSSGALLKPLEMAVLANKSYLVRALLRHGADPNAITKYDLKLRGFNNLDPKLFNPLHNTEGSTMDIYRITPRLRNPDLGSLFKLLYNDIRRSSVYQAIPPFMNDKEYLVAEATILETIDLSPLELACFLNAPDIVRLLLEFHANNSALNDRGVTPLMAASIKDSFRSVAILLEFQAEVNATDIFGTTALHFASIHRTNAEVLVHLLHHNADINARNVRGKTPLMQAAIASNLNGVLKLLEFRANVHVRDQDGWTALHHACFQCESEIVKVLLNRSIIINVRSIKNRTELHYAASCNGTHAEVLLYLLEHNADVDAQDVDGVTPLMQAANARNHDGVMKLLQFQADVNVKNKNGWTALYYALFQCDTNIVMVLLNHNIKINVRDVYYQTELHIAASRNCTNVEVMLHLLQQHADVNAQTFDGETSLMLAAGASNYESVLKLLQFNAGVNVTEKDGWTALHYASVQCESKIVMALLNLSVNINVRDLKNQTALHYAAKGNCTNTEVLLQLVQHHADLNAQNIVGNTPLMVAAHFSNLNGVLKLLGFHANVLVRDKNGWTALHHACLQGCESEIVMVLLNYGISINVRDIKNRTELHYAASRTCPNAKVLLHLLQNRADVNAQDVDGITPLMRAANASNHDGVIKLLQFQADVNVKDKDGRTALHYATMRCASDIVALLLKNSRHLNVDYKQDHKEPFYAAYHGCSNLTTVFATDYALRSFSMWLN